MSAAPELVPLADIVDDYELYAANFLKIKDKSGDTVPFLWNRPQQMLAAAVRWQIEHNLRIRVVVLKSRQVGISTWAQGFLFHRCHLRENRQALTLAHKADSAMKLFEMEQFFYTHLPAKGALSATKQHFTRRQITFAATMSSSQVEIVGEAGRGYTAQYIHGSEVAFWENAKKTQTAVKQAVPRRPDSAVFNESTPNGWGNEFHKGYTRASKLAFELQPDGRFRARLLRRGKSDYVQVFIAWYDDPSCVDVPWFTASDLDEKERELVMLYAVGLPQLAWRRSCIENECDGDVEVFDQEYPSDDVSCFMRSGRSAFDAKGISYQLEHTPPAEGAKPTPGECEIEFDAAQKRINIIVRRKGRLIVFEEPVERHSYIVGLDPSEGDVGSDPTPLAVLDQMTMGYPAVWYGNAPPDIMTQHGINVCTYYRGAQFIWEANNHGGQVKDEVLRIGYPNLYYRQVSADSVAMREGDKLGYMNSVRSRIDLVNTLRRYVREAPLRGWPPIRDPRVVGQFQSFVWDEGRPVADPGNSEAEDDFLIAMGLCLMAHRGAMENPLEPLGIGALMRAYEQLGREHGATLDPIQMAAIGVTCEDLERLDEFMEKREQNQKAKGLRRMN
jgi:hypothetical protein